jgi:hypothetical protein
MIGLLTERIPAPLCPRIALGCFLRSAGSEVDRERSHVLVDTDVLFHALVRFELIVGLLQFSPCTIVKHTSRTAKCLADARINQKIRRNDC